VLRVLCLGLPLVAGSAGVLAEAALFLPLCLLLGLHAVGANVGKLVPCKVQQQGSSAGRRL
jgi:hypothetical protein